MIRGFLFGGLGGLAIGLVGHGLKNGVRYGFGPRELVGIAAGVVIGIVVALIVRRLRKARGNEERA